MALIAGTKLGPYEIVNSLGAGGMGEVYKARDKRLDRIVALKVLPSHVAGDPQIRDRFEREARTISQLNHPHICTLYDVGHHDGVDYLVLEYLEGETVADVLARGQDGQPPLPLEHALAIASQICDALDRAHRHGIVHRDLKPGNVMLVRGRGSAAMPQAKLLDFGLAKIGKPAVSTGLATAATAMAPLTARGTILGTFQYMAPEQLEGREADARSDIWAFGCLLYEMVVGARPFAARTETSLIGSILKDVPPAPSTIHLSIPPALDRLIGRALAKDPEDRWQSIRDLGFELQSLAIPAAASAAIVQARPRVSRREIVAWTIASIALLAATWLVVNRAQGPADARPLRLAILAPEDATFRGTETGQPAFALSPDGAHIAAVVSEPTGKSRLWIRALGATEARPLTGTDGATDPFWAPDGRSIAFFAGAKLKRVDLAGGSPRTLCDAGGGRGGSWNRDGVILFSPDSRTGLYQVSASGGTPVPVTTLNPARGEFSHRFARFLPDGRHFIFLNRTRQVEDTTLEIAALGSTDRRRVMSILSNVEFAAPDLLVFEREGRLFAQRFDFARAELVGEPTPVADPIGFERAYARAAFSVSLTGAVAYSSCCDTAAIELQWFDRAGKLLGSLGPYRHPSLSPDATRVAAVKTDASSGFGDVWLIDFERRTSSRFTLDPLNDGNPVWSESGEIIFASSRKVLSEIYRKNASGGAEQFVVFPGAFSLPDDASHRQRVIVYSRVDPATGWDLWTIPATGGTPTPYAQTTYNEVDAKFSPDGQWMAYASDESGRTEVYVQEFPAGSRKWQISSDGGVQPRWRKDGKELFYLGLDRRLMVADVNIGPGTFRAGIPHALFTTNAPVVRSDGRGGLGTVHNGTSYDVTPDGQRFLITAVPANAAMTSLTIGFDLLPGSGSRTGGS